LRREEGGAGRMTRMRRKGGGGARFFSNLGPGAYLPLLKKKGSRVSQSSGKGGMATTQQEIPRQGGKKEKAVWYNYSGEANFFYSLLGGARD